MLLLTLFLALTAATLGTPAMDRLLGRDAGWVLAVLFSSLAVLVVAQAPNVLVDGRTIEHTLPWMPQIGVEFHLRMDGIGLLFTLLVLGIGAVIMAYSTRYFPPGPRLGFYALMSLFAFAMTGLVLADDLVLLYVFWELTTITSFYLIGLSGKAADRPAIRTFLLTVIGGLTLLAAVVLMWLRTGTTRLNEILADPVWSEDPTFTSTIAVLVMVAVFTKSAQFPFHYWLPDAMAASTPVSAYLHAAAMVKAGIYLAMRFTPAFSDLPLWNTTLITLGLTTALLGALYALQQHDLKTLAAYSTVSQLGLLIATIGVGTQTALTAATIHTLAHALFKATLFMVVGLVDHQTGTRDLRNLGGLRHHMPLTTTIATLAALSMAGIPPLLGFLSKENLFKAFLETPGPAWTSPLTATAAVAASTLTFAYAFRFVHATFWGTPRNTHQQTTHEAPTTFWAPAALPALTGLILGLTPPTLDPLAERAEEDTVGESSPADLSLWHGLTPELGMSVAVIVLGALVVWWTVSGDRLTDVRLSTSDGTRVFETVHDGTIRIGRRIGDLTRSDSPIRHMSVPIFMVILLATVVTAIGPPVPEHFGQVSQPLDWLLVALAVTVVVSATATRSRMACLVMVGVAGYTSALWLFLLGAFDVALTQMLVEILTVVIAALVLRRLPKRFPRVRPRKALASFAVAIPAGAAAALGTYYLTGRRDISETGQYFLEHSEEDTGGTNVTNTVLVDYRALDTFGELVVLGVAGLIIIAVLNSSGLLPSLFTQRLTVGPRSAAYDADNNTLIMRSVGVFLLPVIVVWSAYLLFRGHNDTGGGFIAGLVGGAGFALTYLAASSESVARIRLAYPAIIAGGIIVAVVSGLFGYVDGSFLRPLHADIPLPFGEPFHFTTALVFEVGVYLVVVGVILTALNQLGVDASRPGESTRGTVRPTSDQPPPETSSDDEHDRLIDSAATERNGGIR